MKSGTADTTGFSGMRASEGHSAGFSHAGLRKMNKNMKGTFLVVFSGLCWGLSGVSGKSIFQSGNCYGTALPGPGIYFTVLSGSRKKKASAYRIDCIVSGNLRSLPLSITWFHLYSFDPQGSNVFWNCVCCFFIGI